MKVLILFILVFSSNAFAIALECSKYPLITYPEREVIKKYVNYNTKANPTWGSMSTKQRIAACRSLASTLRRK